MKKINIIYWKKYNYKWVDFMDYILLEKSTSENLYIKWYDFMWIYETKAKTKQLFEDRLKTQIKKLEENWYNYWDIITELRCWKNE